MTESDRPDWPTLTLLAGCYAAWLLATTVLAAWSPPIAVATVAIFVALHSSLTHEVVHGHPFPRRDRLNALSVAPPLGLFIPFGRFRDTHLAHHHDADLTDPYDDPESNYLDPKVWRTLPRWAQSLLSANNTLLGRIILGPAIGLFAFIRDDLRLIRAGDTKALSAWLWHIPALAVVVIWLATFGQMSALSYVFAAYLGLSIIKIRTFLEHQAHDRVSGRTAIVESSCPLSWLFLNNNLHVVHHMHPQVPWYRLPQVYRARAEYYRRRNGGYVYGSYREVFSRHLLRRKDQVAHPLR